MCLRSRGVVESVLEHFFFKQKKHEIRVRENVHVCKKKHEFKFTISI